MRLETADTAEFLRIVEPALRSGDERELARRITTRWTTRQICQVLQDERSDVRRIACVALAACGDLRVTRCLARTLRDTDRAVSQMAEQALWSIWFRAGSLEARRPFCNGLTALGDNDYGEALRLFQKACKIDPEFAEAYNQAAIVHYFNEQWVESMDQSRRAIELNAVHFGAMTGLGHCYFHLGDFADATRWYRKALAINPRMHSVADALARIDRCLQCQP